MLKAQWSLITSAVSESYHSYKMKRSKGIQGINLRKAVFKGVIVSSIINRQTL